MTTQLQDYLSTREVAEKFKVTIADVQRYIRNGTLVAEKVGYFWLIHKDAVPKTWPPSK